MAEKVDSLSMALRGESELSAVEFVLAAPAVARAKDCLFVWSVQAPNARRAGVSEAVIAAIEDPSRLALDEDQADIVSYARQVVNGRRVDAPTFERLKQRHGVRWLVELTTTAGHFGLICGINNAFEVPPLPQGDQLAV